MVAFAVGRTLHGRVSADVLGMFVPFMTLKRDWEKCLLVEAVRLCEGDTIYGHDDLYPYPPLPALLAVPFAYLPFHFGQVVFYMLNMLVCS